MHWKETVIKSKSIKWKAPKLVKIPDGKLDIFLELPLASLFEDQAKQSFAHGMFAVMQFHAQRSQEDKKVIELSDLVKLFNECGLPEIAKQFTPKPKRYRQWI